MNNEQTKTLDLGINANHNSYGGSINAPSRAAQIQGKEYSGVFNPGSLEVTDLKEESAQSLNNLERSIPWFYKREIFYNTLDLIFGLLVILGFGTGLILLCLYIYFNNKSWHIVWAALPFGILALFIGYRTISSYANIKGGLKHEYIFSKAQIAVNIKRAYKNLRLIPVNMNWLSAAIYLTIMIAIIVTLVSAFAINLITIANLNQEFTREQINASKTFGYLYVLKANSELDKWPLYSIIVNGTIGIGTLILQIYLIINSSIRARAIENFYGKMPIEEEDMHRAIVAANKRNFKIFLVYLIIIGLVVLLVKKIITGSLSAINKKKVISIK
ncbi:hypothetical protein BAX51_01775 [Mycoplasmoides gallisepticum]|uniref:Uncharacterized protein n=1 Tax=Mycoplasmoides gallisepticum TaxID=2096 RepID=A0AB36DTW7_MYCGL|nr:hypothetical protein [Mycoplasmoides gallisepticum]OBU78949.1 hypothetical protein BAY36_00655 [Mycoplasmoides gallisepticum]OBU79296.1 hypothetical protein BAY37_02255 [Mycoplasmoides gallisepticum]OBU79760.1 hypothetical protein BAX52_03875 [Mycoplasmoides gallisepticum]OBU80874.1 hypothetical protein BAX51_01775 [Mycoplasmoides gallisepticum]OBU81327.1 hypothetical protein BAX53_00805 [Mycoplasmoides gallisepticum]